MSTYTISVGSYLTAMKLGAIVNVVEDGEPMDEDFVTAVWFFLSELHVIPPVLWDTLSVEDALRFCFDMRRIADTIEKAATSPE